jgi:hypothetical protein
VPYCRPPRRTPFKNICGRVALRVFEFFFSPTALTARPEAILEHLDTARPTATCAVVANQPFFGTMRKSVRRRNRALPLMMTEMMLASWETMARRTLMIAQNACSPAEYKRMVIEKAAAFRSSTLAAMSGRGMRAVLAPWHLRAAANAKRLRRKRRAVPG